MLGPLRLLDNTYLVCKLSGYKEKDGKLVDEGSLIEQCSFPTATCDEAEDKTQAARSCWVKLSAACYMQTCGLNPQTHRDSGATVSHSSRLGSRHSAIAISAQNPSRMLPRQWRTAQPIKCQVHWKCWITRTLSARKAPSS